ncbi:AAA domain-containing protein, putative AbiEii toxin, Type IV TA system [Sulfitobacter litoralis]|uniref:AAA domain-containing protein, putative AbiEii toxin, Type IV TA system n=1 Tax=Sulfitobacter litoralis TaxID=335975 RepID=A0ABY0RRT7_9RHOB|nr:AAA family ATPase [Sulfitobacter litoralis]SDO40473.1 AAA domain-containing protein, putative AbiEii toxin, Type IV TA system [Sulfitobacter litoralis]
MRIRQLAIRNFRGIQKFDWVIPEAQILCLIGRGDSRKSTLLEAIRRLFHPHWNLSFDDADFYQCNPEHLVVIEAVLGDLSDSFKDLEKYGHWLCGWNAATGTRAADPGEGLEDALRVRLAVGDDLEPAWSVIKDDDNAGVQFKASDRAKASVSLIGATSDRHLTWSRGSILSQLTETENINSSLAVAGRAAKAALETRRTEDLNAFDAVAETAENTARSLGVAVQSSFKAHLDSDAINVRVAGLALHDGDVPLRLLGLGSKRMLTTGMQKRALLAPHITLFDEVEVGLEPHRIARLLKHLKDDTSGQYFLTTHSPVVLRELTIADLHVVHCHADRVEVVKANKPGISDIMQGKIRSGAEAFLAPNIIVCEGVTEVGFLRGLDGYWSENRGLEAFAYCGVALFDAAGGGNIRATASGLQELGYNVAILADSDDDRQFSDAHAEELQSSGIFVVKWNDEATIEERVFLDLSWEGIRTCFEAARTIIGNDTSLIDQIQSRFGDGLEPNFENWVDTPRLRAALGRTAKEKGWFKRQDFGADWANAIAGYLEDTDIRESDLVQKINQLRGWIDGV